jgi:hypothetical protein
MMEPKQKSKKKGVDLDSPTSRIIFLFTIDEPNLVTGPSFPGNQVNK